MDLRIGNGYDVHRLVPGRRLMLGCVEVPHETGLLGHSDADVLCHAIADAMLGAAGLGDIGRHFPDSDPAFEGVSGAFILWVVVLSFFFAGSVIVCGNASNSLSLLTFISSGAFKILSKMLCVSLERRLV